jgi:hypothetical protein
LQSKPKLRLVRDVTQPLVAPSSRNLVCSMDLIHATLTHGRSCRQFNMLDDYNRKVLWIEVEFSLQRSGSSGRWGISSNGASRPDEVHCDNGPEYQLDALMEWSSDEEFGSAMSRQGSHRRKPASSTSSAPCARTGDPDTCGELSKKCKTHTAGTRNERRNATPGGIMLRLELAVAAWRRPA